LSRGSWETVAITAGGGLLGGAEAYWFTRERKVSVGNSILNKESGSSNTTRVGRWMSKEEYNKMRSTNTVQESYSGTTHVSNPANPNSFKGAPKDSIYVEFNVPTSSLKPTSTGWSKIIGPNSLEGRHYLELGLPKPVMPPATNIKIVRGNG
jgi:hypothetical protein